jgi:hypothetical protein
MRSVIVLPLAFVHLLGCILLASSVAEAQEKRIALVIGNAQYREAPPLANPKNDATDVGAALESLGFQVMTGLDLDKSGTEKLIGEFAEALAGAKVGLFFYAGHGLQVNGQNYLVPVDAKLRTAASLDFEMVRLDLIQRTMERETTTNIIILDACRDNPLTRNLARALGTRSTQVGRGLASIESGEGTLISFSTQPGNVSLDGTGRNSPFSAALVKHITTPGEDLPTILINTRNDVMAATERRQVPWEHSAMTARFFFSAPKASQDQAAEIALWDSVRESPDPQVVGTYLHRYPQGTFAVVARNLMDALDYQRQMQVRVQQERDKHELQKADDSLRKAQEAAKAAQAAAKTAALQPQPQAVPPAPSPAPPTRTVGRAAFDGVWRFARNAPDCRIADHEFATIIRDGRMQVKQGVGSVQASGEFSYVGTNERGRFNWTGRLEGSKGSGTFSFERPEKNFRCGGTVTVTRVGD